MIPSKISIGKNSVIKFLFESDDVEYYSQLKYDDLELEDLHKIITDTFPNDKVFIFDVYFDDVTRSKLLSDTNTRENLFDAADNGKLYCLRKYKSKYMFFYDYGFNKKSLFEDILYLFKKWKISMVKVNGADELEKIVGSLDPYLNY